MSFNAKRPSQINPGKAKLLTQVSDNATIRLNADVDPNLYHAIKVHCALENRSISEMTRFLWVQYLKSAQKISN